MPTVASSLFDPSFWTAGRRAGVLAAYLVVLVTATHWPAEELMPAVGRADKLVHFLAYAVLAWLLAWAAEGRFRLRWAGMLVLVWSVATVLGGIDELTQPPFNRTADVYDWLADGLGAAAAIAAYAFYGACRRRAANAAAS